jgi:hypothetical protein
LKTRNLHVALLLLVAGCGGRTDYDPGLSGEAGPNVQADAAADTSTDAMPVEDAQPTPDADVTDASIPDAVAVDASSAFCSGPSKIEMAHGMPVEVPVSTGLIAMDCCDAFAIRFHGGSSVGMDIEFMFQTYGPIQEGTFALGATATEYNAVAYVLGDPEYAMSPVVGELQIETTEPQSAWSVRLCGEVQEPGSALDGTRLFADWSMVASWGWDSRFEVRLLADSSINAVDAMNSPLGALELGASVVTLSQLAAYDWSDHTLILQGPWSSTAGLFGSLPTVPVHGLPFVLTVDGQGVYLGAFTTIVSSVMVPLPSISVDDPTKDRITIQIAPVGSVDVREDPRVSSLMKETGKLVP